MINEAKFISLLRDMTFKTLWISGDKKTHEFFNRIIYNVIGFSIRDYKLSSNELGLTSYKSIANKVDILLVSPDGCTKVNIELNKTFTKVLINKNNTYLLKLGGDVYSGVDSKYSFNISVTQINLNNFKSIFDPEYTINEYGFYNTITKTERMNVKTYDITLPKKDKPCYDISEEFKKDLLMFTAENYEEMAVIAKGNKERESVMEELKRLGSDPEFIDYYDHEEFEELEQQELLEQAHVEGHASGLAESIVKMAASGMSIEKISSILEMSITEVENYLKNK